MNGRLFYKLFRYGLVGFFAFICYFLVIFITLEFLKWPIVWGNLLATLCTALVSYFGHHSFTFRKKGEHFRYFSRFSLQFVLTFFVSTWIMQQTAENHWPYFYAVSAVSFILPIINFLVMQFWTFFKRHSIDDEIKQQRFKWPKTFSPLSKKEKEASEAFMKRWHLVLPKKYRRIETFNHNFPLRKLPAKKRYKTLEIGAGLGEHLSYEKLEQQDYYCIELRKEMGDEISKRFPKVNLIIGDCQKPLNLKNHFFDRILAIHVLEHLPNLPLALKEIARLLNPKGVFSIVIPCDPGCMYGFARKISAERIFYKEHKMNYKPIIRREHINSPDEIISCLKKHFILEKRTFFPFRIPSVHLNLCMGMHLKKLP